jgi:hypothetical protein
MTQSEHYTDMYAPFINATLKMTMASYGLV